MAHHFEIHRETKWPSGKTHTAVLLESALPNVWCGATMVGQGFTARKFDTRGGAKNYIHKYGIGPRARVVRVVG